MAGRINADKPHLWKADIAASVDQFNEWFMRFAPEAFRATRVKTTESVKVALISLRDLRSIDEATLRTNPSVLPTLRMCTAPRSRSIAWWALQAQTSPSLAEWKKASLQHACRLSCSTRT